MKKLGEICDFENGDRGKNYPSKSKYVATGIPFVNAGHLENGKLDFSNMNYISKETFDILSRGKFKGNDLLFCLRGSLGKFALIKENESGGIASSLVIVRPNNVLYNYFLSYYFESDLCRNFIADLKGGAAQPNLGAKDLKKFQIPIPPLAEQKQIVALLDQAFAAIDQAKANIEKNMENAKELLESLIQASIEGYTILKEQPNLKVYFSNNSKITFSIPKTWEWAALDSIAEFHNGDRGKNYPNKSEYVPSGIPWINTGHIRVDVANVKFHKTSKCCISTTYKIVPQASCCC